MPLGYGAGAYLINDLGSMAQITMREVISSEVAGVRLVFVEKYASHQYYPQKNAGKVF